MDFNQALTAVIEEQYQEHKKTAEEFGMSVDNRDLFILGRPNFQISYEIYNQLFLVGAVDYGTFNNCREYGVTFSRNGWTFCVYQHRNSDQICIEGCPTDEVERHGPYGGKTKYDTLSTDPAGEFHKVAERLSAALNAASPNATRKSIRKAMVVGDGYEELIHENVEGIANALDKRDGYEDIVILDERDGLR